MAHWWRCRDMVTGLLEAAEALDEASLVFLGYGCSLSETNLPQLASETKPGFCAPLCGRQGFYSVQGRRRRRQCP